MSGSIGIDFGTSNTSAAVWDGAPRLLELEPGRTAIPTAVFLDFGTGRMLFGTPAVAALVEGREGRFLRALKRVLGTPLLREPRQLLNRRMTLLDLVAEVLERVRIGAEAATGSPIRRVVAGRPVRFQPDADRDAQAATDLAEAYRLAGFTDLDWLAEPEAAALACGVTEGRGLVVDIGGGTSDFTLFEATRGRIRVIASEGVRQGGTDADRALSLAHVMPRLGMGSLIRAEFGPNLTTAPVAPYVDLATWEKIAFLHRPEMRRQVQRLTRLADRPDLMERFATVLEHELGFDLAFAVEAGKIAANAGEGRIDLGLVEPGLAPPLTADRLARDLAGFAGAVAAAAQATLAKAGAAPASVTHIVYVGGSSLLAPVRARIEALLPDALPVETAAFTAVAEGLAIAAGR